MIVILISIGAVIGYVFFRKKKKEESKDADSNDAYKAAPSMESLPEIPRDRLKPSIPNK